MDTRGRMLKGVMDCSTLAFTLSGTVRSYWHRSPRCSPIPGGFEGLGFPSLFCPLLALGCGDSVSLGLRGFSGPRLRSLAYVFLRTKKSLSVGRDSFLLIARNRETRKQSTKQRTQNETHV